MNVFFPIHAAVVESVISAPSPDVSLWYQAMWISVYMLLLPSVQCQRACLGEKIQNLTSTKPAL